MTIEVIKIENFVQTEIMSRFYVILSRFANRTNFHRVVNNCINRRFLQKNIQYSTLPYIFPKPTFDTKLPISVILSLSGISLINNNNKDENQLNSRILKAIKNGNISKISRQLKSRTWNPNERCDNSGYRYFRPHG